MAAFAAALSAALVLALTVVSSDIVGFSSQGVSDTQQQQGQHQGYCSREDSDSCRATAAEVNSDSDGGSDCRDWARAEAASERVPDWLHRLRDRHPCPVDGVAAAGASDWKDDFCCSRRGRSGWMSVATGWLRPWLCGGPNCHYHVGADFCVRSPAVPLPDGSSAGQQCCYHGDQQRLLTHPAAGAGTADRRVDLFGHWSEDVRPFLTCCRTNGQLNLASPRCAVYFKRRPSNTGREA